LSREETPSASAAMSKLVFANLLQDLSAIALEVEGLEGLYPSAPSEDIERLQHGYFWAAAMRIAGGADEVLRNQLAERVLGLPGDLRVDKNVPFSAVPAAR
jgi:alkylation response protein AidB-like acyl-CoA dehydrogenase